MYILMLGGKGLKTVELGAEFPPWGVLKIKKKKENGTSFKISQQS